MARTTQAAARAILAQLGCTLRYDSAAREFRVNFKGGEEATAYYTNDIQDAIDTGRAMVQRKQPAEARAFAAAASGIVWAPEA